MEKLIRNIVFTKNRPLQLEAYLESLFRFFPRQFFETFIIYKEELFDKEYESLFQMYKDCRVIREKDFHTDCLNVINNCRSKYILFGIDDVVFFDSVDVKIIDETFESQGNALLGFSFRFSPESLKNSNDSITDVEISGQKVYRVNWKQGQDVHTRYPFELCSTIYKTETVKKIINGTMNNSPLIKSVFSPDSVLLKCLRNTKFKRTLLKRFGFFFSPNTFESWNCRWCQRNAEKLADYTYFQKLCASTIQVNMVNTSTENEHNGTAEHTVEALNEKYKQGYRFDIDFLVKNKPASLSGGREYFKLKRIADISNCRAV
jgi:hypothetical protein